MRAPPRALAVVLVSGGMDSCVTAYQAREDGNDLALLHGRYGQLTARKELASFRAIAARLGVVENRRLVVDLPHLGAIGGSSLTDPAVPVERSPIGTAAGTVTGIGRSDIPSSYVPFRNAHFLAAAVSWAEVIGANAVYVGAVEEDSSGYPDCRDEFFRAWERVVELGTRPATHIRIVRPLIHLDKGAIVTLGLRLGVPFELTWSCYQDSERACGGCDSCVLRLRGFARAGAVDPIPYRALPA